MVSSPSPSCLSAGDGVENYYTQAQAVQKSGMERVSSTDSTSETDMEIKPIYRKNPKAIWKHNAIAILNFVYIKLSSYLQQV